MSNDLVNSILDSGATGMTVKPVVTATSRELDVLNIKAKILEMNEALLAANPRMPLLLRDIHIHLQKDPELVTIITEEEIGMIVNGLKKQTQTTLVTAVIKQSTSAVTKKKLSNLTVDDL
jgi:hypothetical protein